MSIQRRLKGVVIVLTVLMILILVVFLFLRTRDAYLKLQMGLRVNIAIIGDSIGIGAGASDEEHRWANLLLNGLRRDYGDSINLDNYSMGGNSSYAGYVSVKKFDNNSRNYDLAIICYGQNDKEKGFGLYYESIIYALYQHNPRIQIISILESPQEVDNEKMTEIKKICEYYGIPVVDTITPFQEYGYSLLTDDGVHPNDLGYEIYYKKVKECISLCVNNRIKCKKNQNPLYEEVTQYKNLACYEDLADAEYSGVLGISYFLNENQNIEVYKAGELILTKQYGGFPQTRYVIVDNQYVEGQQNLYTVNIEGIDCVQEWFVSYE